MSIDLFVDILFVIMGIALIGWIGNVISEIRSSQNLDPRLSRIISTIFSANPSNNDVKWSYRLVRFALEAILPMLFWLLIVLPIFIFPIILVLGPAFHVPWTTLFPLPP